MKAREINERNVGFLPGLLGVEMLEIGESNLKSRLEVRPELLAPNGYLHAATAVALADTSCGWGVLANLPDGAAGFATLELTSNFLGTVREGAIFCEATLAHGGRSTQVWDAKPRHSNATYICTSSEGNLLPSRSVACCATWKLKKA